MKLAFSSHGFKFWLRPTFSRVLFYSSAAPLSKITDLHNRIFPEGEPWVSMVPILDQWTEQGNTLTKRNLKDMVMKLQRFKRYKHALEISQWMSKRWYFEVSPGDLAARLDLISKVHGIEQAEKYFASIPEQSKDHKIYNSLLMCYANKKYIEKAETLIKQMKELGLASTSLVYNVLLNLYLKVGQHEKIETLMEEMNEMGVMPDKYTFKSQLSTYAATSDIDKMEKVLQKMELDPNVNMEWSSYTMAANGYIKAGLIDKALEMLQKSEEMITNKDKGSAYDFLLSLYAAAGRKEDLYRIWNLYKSSEKVNNKAYRCMIGSLLKLDDIAGAEKILEDWEIGNTSYDFRVPNLLIAAYCKNNLLEKAEMLVNKAMEKGKPLPNTWAILSTGFIEANQFPKAVDAIKAAFSARRPGWRPKRDTLAACLVYLKKQGDAEKTEEVLRLLRAPGHMTIDNCEDLLDYIYTHDDEAAVGMDGDCFDGHGETYGIAEETS